MGVPGSNPGQARQAGGSGRGMDRHVEVRLVVILVTRRKTHAHAAGRSGPRRTEREQRVKIEMMRPASNRRHLRVTAYKLLACSGERANRVAIPGRKLAERVGKSASAVAAAVYDCVFRDLIWRWQVKRTGIHTRRAQLPAKPGSHLAVGAAVERELLATFAGFARESQTQVGQAQSEPTAAVERMRDEATERVVPSEIGVFVVRTWSDIRARRAGEPLRGVMGLQARLAQAGGIDASYEVPFRCGHRNHPRS